MPLTEIDRGLVDDVLEARPGLSSLNLKNNELAAVGPELRRLRTLAKLDLSGNRLACVEGLAFPLLRDLRLRGNRLCAAALANLGTSCPLLAQLDIRDNLIEALDPFLPRLRGLTALKLSGNPVCSSPAASRAALQKAFPQLAFVDGVRQSRRDPLKSVTSRHNVQAAPSVDCPHRESVTELLAELGIDLDTTRASSAASGTAVEDATLSSSPQEASLQIAQLLTKRRPQPVPPTPDAGRSAFATPDRAHAQRLPETCTTRATMESPYSSLASLSGLSGFDTSKHGLAQAAPKAGDSASPPRRETPERSAEAPTTGDWQLRRVLSRAGGDLDSEGSCAGGAADRDNNETTSEFVLSQTLYQSRELPSRVLDSVPSLPSVVLQRSAAGPDRAGCLGLAASGNQRYRVDPSAGQSPRSTPAESPWQPPAAGGRPARYLEGSPCSSANSPDGFGRLHDALDTPNPVSGALAESGFGRLHGTLDTPKSVSAAQAPAPLEKSGKAAAAAAASAGEASPLVGGALALDDETSLCGRGCDVTPPRGLLRRAAPAAFGVGPVAGGPGSDEGASRHSHRGTALGNDGDPRSDEASRHSHRDTLEEGMTSASGTPRAFDAVQRGSRVGRPHSDEGASRQSHRVTALDDGTRSDEAFRHSYRDTLEEGASAIRAPRVSDAVRDRVGSPRSDEGASRYSHRVTALEEGSEPRVGRPDSDATSRHSHHYTVEEGMISARGASDAVRGSGVPCVSSPHSDEGVSRHSHRVVALEGGSEPEVGRPDSDAASRHSHYAEVEEWMVSARGTPRASDAVPDGSVSIHVGRPRSDEGVCRHAHRATALEERSDPRVGRPEADAASQHSHHEEGMTSARSTPRTSDNGSGPPGRLHANEQSSWHFHIDTVQALVTEGAGAVRSNLGFEMVTSEARYHRVGGTADLRTVAVGETRSPDRLEPPEALAARMRPVPHSERAARAPSPGGLPTAGIAEAAPPSPGDHSLAALRPPPEQSRPAAHRPNAAQNERAASAPSEAEAEGEDHVQGDFSCPSCGTLREKLRVTEATVLDAIRGCEDDLRSASVRVQTLERQLAEAREQVAAREADVRDLRERCGRADAVFAESAEQAATIAELRNTVSRLTEPRAPGPSIGVQASPAGDSISRGGPFPASPSERGVVLSQYELSNTVSRLTEPRAPGASIGVQASPAGDSISRGGPFPASPSERGMVLSQNELSNTVSRLTEPRAPGASIGVQASPAGDSISRGGPFPASPSVPAVVLSHELSNTVSRLTEPRAPGPSIGVQASPAGDSPSRGGLFSASPSERGVVLPREEDTPVFENAAVSRANAWSPAPSRRSVRTPGGGECGDLSAGSCSVARVELDATREALRRETERAAAADRRSCSSDRLVAELRRENAGLLAALAAATRPSSPSAALLISSSLLGFL
ncbi:hypothetical protein DIPPA_35844 [Diplonema papillatum]|nr:hypothetical protein DIPPA_35844 [Diplonema papillatum]